MESIRDFLLKVMLSEPTSSLSFGRTGGFIKSGNVALSGPWTLFLVF